MKAMFVLPYDNGIQFPGLGEDVRPDYCIVSYAPPPPGTAQFVLAEIRTDAGNVDILKAPANCLYLAEVTEEGYSTDALIPTERNAIRTKCATLFTGAIYGLLLAAILSSQNRTDLVYALATKAFFRNVAKDFMTEADLRGAGLG